MTDLAMNMEDKKIGGGVVGRIKYIDIAKIISVFFVLVDHIQYFLPVNNSYMVLRVIWIAFFLQVFFMATGITSSYPIITSVKDIIIFIDKKLRALIIPYFIWCFFLNMYGNHDISFFIRVLLGKQEDLNMVGVNGVLWFFPVIFMSNVITLFAVTGIHYIRKKISIHINFCYLIMSLVLIVFHDVINNFYGDYLSFGLRSGFCGSALIFMGMFVKDVLNVIYRKFSIIKKIFLSLFLFAIGIPLAYVNMPVMVGDTTVSYPHAIWIGMGKLGRNCILFMLVSFCMSMGIIILSMCLERVRVFSYWGKHSFLFMTIHIYTHSIVAAHIIPAIRTFVRDDNILIFLFFLISVCMVAATIPFVDRYMPFLYKPIKKQGDKYII